MDNLAQKYRPSSFDQFTEQSVIVEIVKKMCESKDLTNRNLLFIGPAGCGKAQPLYSKVLTTDGFIAMKDVEVGTRVLTRNGNVAQVIGVFPQGYKPVYEITLQDETKIRVAEDHLNVVYRYNEDRKQREEFTLTTKELINLFNESRFKLRIDVPQVEFDNSYSLPIDPYLLGCLIGDGSLHNSFNFSNSEQDIVTKVDNILRRDYSYCLKKIKGDNVDWSISPIKGYKYKFIYMSKEYYGCEHLREQLISDGYPWMDNETLIRIGQNRYSKRGLEYPKLLDSLKLVEVNNEYNCNVLHDKLAELNLLATSLAKHIPHCYLVSSREDRIRLLQGLYDTDGYTDKSGNTEFTTTSSQLSEDFAFLVRSLGIRDTVKRSKAGYKTNDGHYVECNDAYTHYLHSPKDFPLCTSQKHLARYRNHQNDPIRNIVSIEYVGEEECQCIYVDDPDHTYVSDGFIPTHNTSLCRAIGNVLNEGKGEPIEMDAASHSGVDSVREIITQATAYPVGTKYKIFILDEVHAFSSNAWQALLKTLEMQPARSIFMMATTNPEKIPATIISRVQTFQLSKISLEGINSRLKYIIAQENAEGQGITYTDEAVLYISKLAQGGMRDGITLLSKAISYDKNITIESLQQSLGLPKYEDFFELLNAIVKKDNQKIVTIINNVYNSGVNFVKWFENFFSFVTNIVKFIYLKDINQTMIPSIYQDKISGYGTPHAVLCLKLSNKLAKMNQELKTTQYLQELAISYLCTPPAVKKA